MTNSPDPHKAAMANDGPEKPSRRQRHSFNPELAKLICDRIAEGWSLRKICQDANMPARSTQPPAGPENRQDLTPLKMTECATAIAHLACRKLDLARFGELARIAEEIEKDLPQPHGVHGEDTQVLLGVDSETVLVLLGKLSGGPDDLVDQRC